VNKKSDDPEIQKRMPKLPQTFSESIVGSRAKSVMAEFLKHTGSMVEFNHKMLKAGAHKRIRGVATILFDQRLYRKKLVFNRVWKEIEFLTEVFNAIGSKKEKRIAD